MGSIDGVNDNSAKNVPTDSTNTNQQVDRLKQIYEQSAISIFGNLNTNGDSVIDERDEIDKSMLKALQSFVGDGTKLTLESLKQVANKLQTFTYTKQGEYNGHSAIITYDIY